MQHYIQHGISSKIFPHFLQKLFFKHKARAIYCFVPQNFDAKSQPIYLKKMPKPEENILSDTT